MDGDKILIEYNDGDTIYYTYDVDGTLTSMNYNRTEYYYVTNMQGDVIKLIDVNGLVKAEYKYDAWGNVIYKTGSLADIKPYRYRGYRYDEELGLYYLQSRYYNPETHRFISADGLLGEQGNILGHNMYAYCQNNPVMYIDPNGEWAVLAMAVLRIITINVTEPVDYEYPFQ